MCTAISFGRDNFCFGRTLDHTGSFGESVLILPRQAPLPIRQEQALHHHYAIIGIGCIRDGFPLYYDGVNEKGLAMAGLNFTKSACYKHTGRAKYNIAQFELLPWLLGQCATVTEASDLLKQTCVTDTAFSPELPPAKLHWLLSDGQETIVLEAMQDGLHLYPNPTGVLTNEPPFPIQMLRLNDYMGLSTTVPENRFSPTLPLQTISLGSGALGLPGDTSSQSRFVRAVFWKEHLDPGCSELQNVHRFFQLMDTVRVLPGCCKTETGEDEYTLYQSCYHNGICYYSTSENRQITAVDLNQAPLDGNTLVHYPLKKTSGVELQNSHKA